MTDEPPPLQLRIHEGRENGLMIVGTASSLRALAEKLLMATGSDAVAREDGWPVLIASPAVQGPYSDVEEYGLSFHLQNESLPPSVFPLRRRALHWPLLVIVAVCAVAGAVSVLRWVLA